MSQLHPEVTVAPMVDCFDRLSTWLSKGVVVDGLTVTTEETMKLKFDFDYQQLPHLEGKKIAGISFGIGQDDLKQFVSVELDDGTELIITSAEPAPEARCIEFELIHTSR